MDVALEFAKSDIGVGIAWLCTVGSLVYSLIKRSENRILNLKVKNLESIVSVDAGQDAVAQTGGRNVYTKHNAGGMNIRM